VVDGRPQGEPVVVRPNVGKVDLKGFTRDGSLYYGTNQVDSDLYQIAFDPGKGTADPKRISERFIGANFEPEPSPDGTLLAFFRGEPGDPGSPYTTSLVIRSVRTGKEVTLLTGLFVDRQRRCMRWFPDGRSLLVHEWKAIRRVDAQTGETRTLLETPAPIWMHTEVSRDGKALFYSSRVNSPQGLMITEGIGKGSLIGTLRLIRRDLDTGEEKVLYHVESGQAALYGISLSPDGTRLAFGTSERVNNEPFGVLVTMPENGGAVKEVFRTSLAGSQDALQWWGATWTRDGRYILAIRDIRAEKQSNELVAFPVDGGEPRVLATMPGEIYDPTAAPDGQHILFTNARRSRELWVMRNFLPQTSR
jgi:Tol biopolymer transport system component